jgi:hypothetical protein
MSLTVLSSRIVSGGLDCFYRQHRGQQNLGCSREYVALKGGHETQFIYAKDSCQLVPQVIDFLHIRLVRSWRFGISLSKAEAQFLGGAPQY